MTMPTRLSSLLTRSKHPLTSIAFNAAKIAGKGEDADPLLRIAQHEHAILGVFDGLGGSGSMRCGGADGVRTNAYYGSRAARDSVDRFLRMAALFADVTPAALAAVLTQRLTHDLHAYDAEWARVGGSRLRSTLFRRLPTTAAVAIVRPKTEAAHATVLWAGDSRCYVLTPTTGLQQLTTDHLSTASDAFANLTTDAPIANCISADAPFYLDGREFILPLPCVVLAATDGCFGYVESPMHFEALVLEALLTARSMKQWRAALRTRITSVAGDDASLALVAAGWTSHRALRKAFADRFRFLTETYIRPLADAPNPQVLRRTLWARYRTSYEALTARRDHVEEIPCTTM
jgi:hypothetical protein